MTSIPRRTLHADVGSHRRTNARTQIWIRTARSCGPGRDVAPEPGCMVVLVLAFSTLLMFAVLVALVRLLEQVDKSGCRSSKSSSAVFSCRLLRPFVKLHPNALAVAVAVWNQSNESCGRCKGTVGSVPIACRRRRRERGETAEVM